MTHVFRRPIQGDTAPASICRITANAAMTLAAGAWLFAAAHPAFAGHWELSNPTVSGSLTKTGVFWDDATQTEDWHTQTVPWSDAYQWNAYYETGVASDYPQICSLSGHGAISVTATWIPNDPAHPELDTPPAKVVAYAWYRSFYSCYNTGDETNWADDGWRTAPTGLFPVYAGSESYHAIHADGTSGTFTITSPDMSVASIDDMYSDVSICMYLGDFDSPDIALDYKTWSPGTSIQGGALLTAPEQTLHVGQTAFVSVDTATDQDDWTIGDLYNTVIESGSDSDAIHYHWSGPGLSVDADSTTWVAPMTPGNYTLTCTIDDSGSPVVPDGGNPNDAPLVRTTIMHVLP